MRRELRDGMSQRPQSEAREGRDLCKTKSKAGASAQASRPGATVLLVLQATPHHVGHRAQGWTSYLLSLLLLVPRGAPSQGLGERKWWHG